MRPAEPARSSACSASDIMVLRYRVSLTDDGFRVSSVDFGFEVLGSSLHSAVAELRRLVERQTIDASATARPAQAAAR